ncbi:MAG: divalent-cation tolerance protein CutA [Burkholderiales bacterium]
MDSFLVFTNLPDRQSAEKLAALLIGQRLAACVNLLAPCGSVYRWRGEIRRDEEHPLLIKTAQDRYAEVEALIRANHPYELPEIIAVPITRGLPAYMQWIAAETRTAAPA